MDIPFDEKFALSPDRKAVLQELLPGTEDFYYYHCLDHEQGGRLEEVRGLLETWVQRHGWTARAQEIANRLALLGVENQPKDSFERIRQSLGLTFTHQREVEGRATNHPTRLDPAGLSREAWKKQAFAQSGSTDLSGFADPALGELAAEKLDPDRRRALLQRLVLPDVPNLVDLVLADLRHKNSSGFGSLEIHGRMTLDQLEKLARSEPKLLQQEEYVEARLQKLQPGPDADWEDDPAEKEAYLQALWDFAAPLVPAFNALKAHVLYHRLDFDRSRKVYDRRRFEEYLKLPRQVGYAEPAYLEKHEDDAFGLGDEHATLLPAVGDDEALVSDYVSHFFLEDADVRSFNKWIVDSWLKVRYAEAKLLHGVGDPEKWYSILNDPARLQALKDRVEISFPPHNPKTFRAADPVSIDVDVKNVGTLVLKVFEINTLNYAASKGADVDTSIDLDGLVAAEERTVTFQEPPIRRVRKTFEFPSLAKPGLYVVEFIGGGISSRALVRKGRLRFLERIGAAGHVFTVLDEDFRPLKGASLWMGGREYAADKDETITVPFTERPGRQAILLRHGELATLEHFEHRAESYAFTAGLYVDREALVRRNEAKLLLRPSLRVQDAPASLKLVEDVTLRVTSTDRYGIESTMEVRGLELREDRETEVPFQVPDDLVRISFAVRGRVESLSLGKKIDVSDERTFTLNGIETTDRTEDLHLARTEEGFVLTVLGKTGEPRPDTPVTLVFAHPHYTFEMHVVLQSDAKGRIELGTPEGVSSIRASTPSGVTETWTPPRDACLRPAVIHARAGGTLRIPFMGEAATRASVALLEQAGETIRKDCFDALSVKDGMLVLSKLAAGNYALVLKDEGAAVELRVAPGERVDGWVANRRRLLEESPADPLQISRLKAGKDEVRATLLNAGPETRVHVFGTRYLPAYSALAEFGREGLAEPWATELGSSPSAYVSGRDLGDEYRYILERKRATKFPGHMLTRPGLLLNPWAVRSTETGTAEAAGGEGYGAAGAPGAAKPSPRKSAAAPADAEAGAFASLDFLAKPSALLANLRPDKDGTVAVPRKALGASRQVRVVAVDPSGTVQRDLFLPESEAEPRDLRLRLPLDPLGHFGEKKEVAVLEPGGKLEIADLTSSKLETYDTLARVFGLFRTITGLSALDAWEFLGRWPKLGDEEKRTKYSEFACHELHLFLSRKDPDFFRSVVKPYLRNKKDKTFMDRCLLGDGLEEWRRPWEFGRLNVVERILLGRAVAGEHGPVGRHAGDLCDLLPRDLARDQELFDTALKGKALEAGDALGMLAATERSEERLSEATAFRGPLSMASTAPPAPPAAEAMMDEGADDADREEAPAKSKKEAAKDRGRSARSQDLRRRSAARALYRTLDQTQEWAENNWYKVPLDRQGPELITINRFWRDWAKHDGKGPFVSVHLAEATRSLAEMLCALAVLDLPFEASKPDVSFEGARMTLKPGGRTVVYHRQIRPAAASAERVPILVSQNFLRDSDRYRHEGQVRYDKYVVDEFLVHTVYVGQVVLTNPTSSPHTLDLLLQIPAGSVPAKNGFATRSVRVALAPYAAQSIEYAFYFPAAGDWTHFPVHVSRNEALIASAPPVRLKAVERLSGVDQGSWDYLSQHADGAAVLRHLDGANVDRLDLGKIAWRMSERKFYDGALELLSKRHVYHDVLWSYAVRHQDAARLRDYLNHHDDWLRRAGLRLDGGRVPIDPVARGWHEHLEYAPLVNARAHRLGGTRKILNTRFAGQYARLLSTLRYRAELTDDDRLAATTYLFLQDRTEEALACFDRIDPEKIEARLQYDYLRVAVEFVREKPKAARAAAEKHRDHPVDRWRKLFRNALAQLDEIDGAEAEAVDPRDRDQRQGALAASEGAFELSIDDRTVTVRAQNLPKARVNYYRLDVELLFSRQPFVQDQSDRFGFIMPNRSDELALTRKDGVHAFDLPAEFRGANVVVEVVAGGRRASKPCFAHELAVQVVEPYGQLRVAQRRTRKPLAKAYVKAYARMKGGGVRFYKDGYTDLRGRFDYSSLSTGDLDGVERFALLVLSEEHGAVIQEAAPPKR